MDPCTGSHHSSPPPAGRTERAKVRVMARVRARVRLQLAVLFNKICPEEYSDMEFLKVENLYAADPCTRPWITSPNNLGRLCPESLFGTTPCRVRIWPEERLRT